VGFSIHTGWVAAVVVADPAALLDRRRVELADRADRFVYHLAAERGDAERRIRDVARVAHERAEAALRELCARHAVAIVAVPRPKRALPPLAEILRSHPLLHTAEGELYRRAVEDAGRAVGLEVVTPAPVAPELEKPGPPWAKDQRDAAALAWGALRGRRSEV
jgi:hypothetical protein